MKNCKYFFLLALSIVFACSAIAQPSEYKMKPGEYVAKYKDDAIKEMFQFGIPASITLAQGMLESDNGNSPLAVYANNHFGIKCHAEWTGAAFIQDDDTKNECFRKYEKALDSYTDHSNFLKTRSRYNFLFSLKSNDYKGWAKGLKQAGYATHPKYAQMLIDLIERNKLYEYDQVTTIPSLTPSNKNNHSEKKLQSNNNEQTVLSNNNVKCVLAKNGDTYESLAKRLDLPVRMLCRFNDASHETVIVAKQCIYIQPKKNRAQQRFHTVIQGETMYAVSQQYGVKLKKLYRKNNMSEGTEPKVGQKLSLRKRVR